MLKKLKTGLILLILISIACVKRPVSSEGNIYSVLFRFSAKVGEKSIHSLRIYINTDTSNKISMSVLLPTNKLIANVFYDKKSLIIVDYNNRTVYIDNKKPFELKKVTGVDIPVNLFFDFFVNCYLKNNCTTGKKDGFRFIVNEKKEIVIIGKQGNVLLKPLSGVVKGGVTKLTVKIPKGFKVIFNDNL
ncbi:hypothetical protein TTHT_1050 [Thermotomaculum hydrothermale]|uniref:Lipoprotein n=1 Tax=Thermotomaculum hydrothermale TaxID=981385 RepID=A0A7R6PHA6_9BACT|nr:hypothetical protein [Thermotomaculum hydrothermale]BBB32589.1 hypothetical protein TTHT_1050 [Thermotomaculum hydrothermale]